MKNKICDPKDFRYFLLLIIFLLEGYFSPFQPSLALKLKVTVNNFIKRCRKIPKISPSMYKPLRIEASQIWNTKIPPITSLQIQAPGGLYLEIILINTNQSKLNIITTIRKSFLVIKELFRALKQCGQQVLKFIVFYKVHSSLTLWIPLVHRQSICKEVQSHHPEPKLPRLLLEWYELS